MNHLPNIASAALISALGHSLLAPLGFAQDGGDAARRALQETARDRDETGIPLPTDAPTITFEDQIEDYAAFVDERLERFYAAKAANVSNDTGVASTGLPAFTLTALTFDTSDYIAPEAFAIIQDRFVGRELDINELRFIPIIINEIYATLGVLTARAALEPQSSENGAINITLFEPDTGEIQFENIGRTNPDFIRARLPSLDADTTDFRQLALDLYRFSTVNNLGLTAGFEPTPDLEIVDLVLQGTQPDDIALTVSANNFGADETGRTRSSAVFQHASLTGRRDLLSLSATVSEGLYNGGLNYAAPIGRRGTRVSVGGSYTYSEIVNNVLEDVSLESVSISGVVNAQYPLVVTPQLVGWIGVGSSIEQLDSKISGVDLLDSQTVDVSIFTNWIWRQPQLVSTLNLQLLAGEFSSSTPGSTEGAFQYAQGEVGLSTIIAEDIAFNTRLGGRLAITENNPSSTQYTAGGVGSVRGYPQNLTSGDSGLSASFQMSLARPFLLNTAWRNDKTMKTDAGTPDFPVSANPFLFLDVGFADPFDSDPNAPGTPGNARDPLVGAGFGVNVAIGRTASLNVTAAFPLSNAANFQAEDEGARVLFRLTKLF